MNIVWWSSLAAADGNHHVGAPVCAGGHFISDVAACSSRAAAHLVRCSLMSADGVEYDHRYLALGLLLVIGVGRPELQRLFPQPRSLLAGGGPRPCLQLRGPDLHVDIRVGDQVAVPARMLRRTALRGDHEITVSSFPV